MAIKMLPYYNMTTSLKYHRAYSKKNEEDLANRFDNAEDMATDPNLSASLTPGEVEENKVKKGKPASPSAKMIIVTPDEVEDKAGKTASSTSATNKKKYVFKRSIVGLLIVFGLFVCFIGYLVNNLCVWLSCVFCCLVACSVGWAKRS